MRDGVRMAEEINKAGGVLAASWSWSSVTTN
jgi:hypothetical protein